MDFHPKRKTKNCRYQLKKIDNFLEIYINDNGNGRTTSATIKDKELLKKDSVGIKLTEERFCYFAKEYKNDFAIIFTDLFDEKKHSTGTRLGIKIPLI